jgi:3-hydroxyisobutyrate dehydrogenase
MRVAVLGTGVMGAGMARSLLRAGHNVAVWNRSPEKAEPLGADGATVCAEPADAVRGAGAIVTMLYDTDSVLEVMAKVLPEVDPDAVWLQSSTIGVEGAKRTAAVAAQAGVGYLDAPVLGTKQPAEDGKLVVLLSGDESLRDRVERVLEALGSRSIWVSGEPGDASALKLACNAWVGSITAATAQSVALARQLGLDPGLFLQAIKGGPTDSPYAQLKGAAMIAGEFAVSFALDGVRKDLGLIREAAVSSGTSTLLMDGSRSCFDRAAELGHGRDDMAAVVAAFTERSTA